MYNITKARPDFVCVANIKSGPVKKAFNALKDTCNIILSKYRE